MPLNGVGRVNEVTLRRARLVMGWVTVFERAINSVSNKPTRLTQLPPPRGTRMSTGRSAAMLTYTYLILEVNELCSLECPCRANIDPA